MNLKDSNQDERKTNKNRREQQRRQAIKREANTALLTLYDRNHTARLIEQLKIR